MLQLTTAGRIAIVKHELGCAERLKSWLEDDERFWRNEMSFHPESEWVRVRLEESAAELEKLKREIIQYENVLLDLGVEVKDLP